MIAWLLRELEKNPKSLFRKKDLLKKQKSQFEKLKRQGFITYSQLSYQHETYPCNLPCPDSCPMEIVEMEGELFAICPKDTEIDPIPLTKDDIAKYRFSLKALIDVIRADNGFTGDNYLLSQHLHFVGERVIQGINTAFILALFHDIKSAESHLLSLPAHIPPYYQQMVVITPSLRLTQEPIYAKLRTASIIPVTLPASFGQRNFRISYLAALRRSLPIGMSSQELELTNERLEDYDKYCYCCRDRLHIPGTIPRQRSNEIWLNGHKLGLGDSLFVLLIRFVVELEKQNGGWVNIYTLDSEEVISDPMKYQIYSRLRTALEGSLFDKDGRKFVENDGSKNYRISTHPDFITYDRQKLLKHPDNRIGKLAKKLPQRA